MSEVGGVAMLVPPPSAVAAAVAAVAGVVAVQGGAGGGAGGGSWRGAGSCPCREGGGEGRLGPKDPEACWDNGRWTCGSCNTT